MKAFLTLHSLYLSSHSHQLSSIFSVHSAFVLLKQQYNELGLRNEENNYVTTWLCPASSYFKDYMMLLFLKSLFPVLNMRLSFWGSGLQKAGGKGSFGLWIWENLALCWGACCPCPEAGEVGKEGAEQHQAHGSSAQANLGTCLKPPGSLADAAPCRVLANITST